MKHSYIVAGLIVVAFLLWMLTGPLMEERSDTAGKTDDSRDVPVLTQVQTRFLEAKPVQRSLTVYGQSNPKRRVSIKAEVAGRVAEVVAERGAEVKAGEVLLRLSKDDRPQRLDQARAALKQRELEYQGSISLKNKGLQAERQLAEAKSLLESARTDLRRAQLDMQHLVVTAPYDGMLQSRAVEVGDFVSIGDPLAEVVDLDPLVVSANVSENEVGSLHTGMTGTVQLSNGLELKGTLTYIAPSAEVSTRTYRIELEVVNPSPHQRGGMTATLQIPLETVSAHKVSPALLSLDDAGELGIKSVDDSSIVHFYPVAIIKSERDGMWLSGLPDKVQLITVGQGFVRAGDHVIAVPAK